MSFYKRLGVPRTASRSEIKHVYKELMKKFPNHDIKKEAGVGEAESTDDAGAGGSGSDELQKIQKAYEVLRAPKRRAHYDSCLHASKVVERLRKTSLKLHVKASKKISEIGVSGLVGEHKELVEITGGTNIHLKNCKEVILKGCAGVRLDDCENCKLEGCKDVAVSGCRLVHTFMCSEKLIAKNVYWLSLLRYSGEYVAKDCHKVELISKQ